MPLSYKARPACCSSTPGCAATNMTCLANDLRELGQPVVAGFSTHPHWDHLLWRASLGHGAPLRHGVLRGHRPRSAVRRGREGPHRRDDPARHRRAGTPDLLGLITGVPANTVRIPWD